MMTDMDMQDDLPASGPPETSVPGGPLTINSPVLQEALEVLRNTPADRLNLAPLASALFKIRGNAYSLGKHRAFEPMFCTGLPRRAIWKCGRQLGKSQNLCGSRLIMGLILPFYNTLFVCPRFSQVKRLSNQYIKPLLSSTEYEDTYLLDKYGEQTTLQRTLRNQTILFFSFALLDADRIRSIFASEVVIDECQDLNWDFIPVIAEVLSGSEVYRNQRFSGTPKTLDNTMEKLWQTSSMSEQAMKCSKCGHWNVACADFDLLDMIQPEGPGCTKCKTLLNPLEACWIHRKPNLRNTFVGYHIPQVTHPYHYGHKQNWMELLYKQKHYPAWRFYNECLGESFESSARLVNLHELQAACQRDRVNELVPASRTSAAARMTALGIDWGGGGEDSKSSTTVTLASLEGDIGSILYMERMAPTTGIQEQIQRIIYLVSRFGPTFVAHDYNGEGAAREVLLIQAGIPLNRIIPFSYGVSAKSAIVDYKKNAKGYRSYYFLDKPRSLVTLCHMIKGGKVTFPRYDTLMMSGSSNMGLGDSNFLDDFLNLTEDRRSNPRGSDIVLVSKVPDTFDDFAHSTNFALTAMWYSSGSYPNISEALSMRISDDDFARIYGTGSW